MTGVSNDFGHSESDSSITLMGNAEYPKLLPNNRDPRQAIHSVVVQKLTLFLSIQLL